MKIDIVYPAYNRLEFTRLTLPLLLGNTPWSKVANFVIYDDGSTDGTREFLDQQQQLFKQIDTEGADMLRFDTDLRSPPAIMNHYLSEVQPHTGVNWMAKVDNDIAVPDRWLERMLDSLYANPDLDILGMAAGWTGVKDGPPSFQPAVHIGGVGLMRVSKLNLFGPIPADGRFGFTSFQEKHPKLNIGWVQPDVQAVQLDLVPDEPWASLSERYITAGWQRRWPPYQDPSLWQWIQESVPA